MTIKSLKGKWRITEMEQWDKDFIDLIEPGFVEFSDKGSGSFHFGCVYTDIDYRINREKKGISKVDFSFYGDDEGSEVFGRGWAKMDGNQLQGYFCFHRGDESTFAAKLIR